MIPTILKDRNENEIRHFHVNKNNNGNTNLNTNIHGNTNYNASSISTSDKCQSSPSLTTHTQSHHTAPHGILHSHQFPPTKKRINNSDLNESNLRTNTPIIDQNNPQFNTNINDISTNVYDSTGYLKGNYTKNAFQTESEEFNTNSTLIKSDKKCEIRRENFSATDFIFSSIPPTPISVYHSEKTESHLNRNDRISVDSIVNIKEVEKGKGEERRGTMGEDKGEEMKYLNKMSHTSEIIQEVKEKEKEKEVVNTPIEVTDRDIASKDTVRDASHDPYSPSPPPPLHVLLPFPLPLNVASPSATVDHVNEALNNDIPALEVRAALTSTNNQSSLFLTTPSLSLTQLSALPLPPPLSLPLSPPSSLPLSLPLSQHSSQSLLDFSDQIVFPKYSDCPLLSLPNFDESQVEVEVAKQIASTISDKEEKESSIETGGNRKERGNLIEIDGAIINVNENRNEKNKGRDDTRDNGDKDKYEERWREKHEDDGDSEESSNSTSTHSRVDSVPCCDAHSTLLTHTDSKTIILSHTHTHFPSHTLSGGITSSPFSYNTDVPKDFHFPSPSPAPPIPFPSSNSLPLLIPISTHTSNPHVEVEVEVEVDVENMGIKEKKYFNNPTEKYGGVDNTTGGKERDIKFNNINNADEDKIDRELELKFEKFRRNINDDIRNLIYQSAIKEKEKDNDRKFNNIVLTNASVSESENIMKNEDENENENENIYDRDASSCPFAVSPQDENYPFVDIALSMYDHFGVRTESDPRSLTSVTDTAAEELLRSSSGLLNDEKRGRARGSDSSSSYGKSKVGDDCTFKMNKNKNCGGLNEGENKTRANEINTTNKYFSTHDNNTKSEIVHGNENYDIDISVNNVDRSNNADISDQDVRCVQIEKAFQTALKVQKVLISLISDVSASDSDSKNKQANNGGSNVMINARNKSGIDEMKGNMKCDSANQNVCNTNEPHATKPNGFNKKCERNTNNHNNSSCNEHYENKANTTNVLNKDENENKLEVVAAANNVNKQLIKEFIDYLSSKSSSHGQKLVGKNCASVLASIDFVEFFLFFLDIQVTLHYFSIHRIGKLICLSYLTCMILDLKFLEIIFTSAVTDF